MDENARKGYDRSDESETSKDTPLPLPPLTNTKQPSQKKSGGKFKSKSVSVSVAPTVVKKNVASGKAPVKTAKKTPVTVATKTPQKTSKTIKFPTKSPVQKSPVNVGNKIVKNNSKTSGSTISTIKEGSSFDGGKGKGKEEMIHDQEGMKRHSGQHKKPTGITIAAVKRIHRMGRVAAISNLRRSGIEIEKEYLPRAISHELPAITYEILKSFLVEALYKSVAVAVYNRRSTVNTNDVKRALENMNTKLYGAHFKRLPKRHRNFSAKLDGGEDVMEEEEEDEYEGEGEGEEEEEEEEREEEEEEETLPIAIPESASFAFD